MQQNQLSEFDLVIAHRPGEDKGMAVPDVLSRLNRITDEEEIKGLLAKTVVNSARLAMQLTNDLKGKSLTPKTQRMRLRHAICAAEVRERAQGAKAESVLEIIRAATTGERSPKERQIEEDEQPSRLDEFYDQICTISTEKCIVAATTMSKKAKEAASTANPSLENNSDYESEEEEEGDGEREKDGVQAEDGTQAEDGDKADDKDSTGKENEETHNKPGGPESGLAENEGASHMEKEASTGPINLKRIITEQLRQ